MSKFIKAITVVASLFAAGSALADDCGDLVFYGQTANHQKEVRVCLFSKDSQNFVNYRFGKVGQKPEMDIVKPASAVTYFTPRSAVISSADLNIPNGEFIYAVGSGIDDTGVSHSAIDVSKNYRTLANIKLDLKTVVNNIGWVNEHDMKEYGMRDDMDEDSLSATTVLASPRS